MADLSRLVWWTSKMADLSKFYLMNQQNGWPVQFFIFYFFNLMNQQNGWPVQVLSDEPAKWLTCPSFIWWTSKMADMSRPISWTSKIARFPRPISWTSKMADPAVSVYLINLQICRVPIHKFPDPIMTLNNELLEQLVKRVQQFYERYIKIMYIYHALINALSAHMTHINPHMTLHTRVEHSPTETIFIK